MYNNLFTLVEGLSPVVRDILNWKATRLNAETKCSFPLTAERLLHPFMMEQISCRPDGVHVVFLDRREIPKQINCIVLRYKQCCG